jgi:hypothetical protein
MPDDVRHLLRIAGFQVPDDHQCTRLQAYWDELTAQARELQTDAGSAEIAVTYAAWRPEDD